MRTLAERISGSTGAVVELVQGLALTGRFFSDRALRVGLRIGLGAADFQAQTQGRAQQTYAARSERSGGTCSGRGRATSLWNCPGPVRHRRFAYFDESQSLLNLIALLERARRDPSIKESRSMRRACGLAQRSAGNCGRSCARSALGGSGSWCTSTAWTSPAITGPRWPITWCSTRPARSACRAMWRATRTSRTRWTSSGSALTSGDFSSTSPRMKHTSAATCPRASASS